MFDTSPKNALSASKTLELIQVHLTHARESKDVEIKPVWCDYADNLLGHMKNLVKRSGTGSKKEGDQTFLQQEIASAYLEHAKLLADLGFEEKAQNSRRRADKWAGPGPKKAAVASSVSKKTGRVPDIASVPDCIFPEDIGPPALPWTFPVPDGRVADAPQLVSCLGLLKQGFEELPEDALDPVACKWLQETANNVDEKARLETMATDLIRAFTRDEIKDKKAVAEVLCLVPILEEDDFRFLLSQFLNSIEGSRILDIGALRGLAQLLQSASPGHLHAQDLIDVLGPVSTRLQETHEKSPDHIFELTVIVSSILDAMADIKMTGLSREELHGPLLAFLGGLQGDNDPHLKYYASYAFQALLCVPDDESPWQATVRRTTKIVKGISGLVSAVKGLDLNGFMTGLQSIQEGFEGVQQVLELSKTTYEGVSAVYEGEKDLIASLKGGLTFNRKCAWYSALRGADTLIDGGELAKFRTLVCGAVCRRELAFQWGVCQRLSNMAANHLWDIETRQGAVRFMEEIYRNDLVWGQLSPVKAYILDILKQLSTMDSDLQAASLLKDLATDGDATKQDIYRNCTASDPTSHMLKSGRPELASPSLLDRVQRRTDVETDLRRIARLRTKERGGTVYVPPLAKASLQASDETLFPLIPMVNEFLVSDDKVLLMLGDSGAGKTTFNRELDLKLWKAYKPKTGRIPLLISLPAIDRPEKDLIAKHLRIFEFSEPQIRELKDREFVIICDGYDESQQIQNLYESNGLNKDGKWKAQMVVSCRSEHIGQDYRDLFQPAKSNPSDIDLFRQAVLVPFSMAQVKEYISQYVAITRPLWVASDYEGVLDQIPSLQDLVKNPFLLTLSLEVLPRITDPGQKLASSKITRVQLYDEFVAQWLERSKKRLVTHNLGDQERKAFENLSDDGFTQQGLNYLKKLSAMIYLMQDGNPFVDYSKARDVDTWKEDFFGRKDEEIRLLQRAVPMTRSGSRFGFIHRSILEYGVSRAIYEPQGRLGLKLETAESDRKRRKSIDSTYSFEMDDVVASQAALEEDAAAIETPLLNSPLAKKDFVRESSVLQFLAERVQQEPLFKEQLHAVIERSKTDKMVRRAAANAITVLIKAGVQFNGADLQRIKIPGADLSTGVFDSAQLQGADLRKVKLRSSWLRRADLSGAYMAGVQFGEWPYLEEASLVQSCAYSPDGKACAIGLGDVIRVYDTSSWENIHTLRGHRGVVSSVVYSPSGAQIASGSQDKTVRLWEAQNGTPGHTLQGHTDVVQSVVYSPSGMQIASGSDDKTVRLWDVQSGVPGHILQGHTDVVNSVVYSPSGLQIASGSDDKTVRLWDAQIGAPRYILQGHTGWVKSVVYSPNGAQIASGSSDNTIRLWDTQSGALWHTLEGHTAYVWSVAYSPSGTQIASGSWDTTVRLWDTQTGAPGHIFEGHTGEIFSLVYSPSGAQIASGGVDRTVRLWDVPSGVPRHTLQGHTNTVSSVVYSPSGMQIASSSDDETVRLWDAQIGAPGHTLRGHLSAVMSVVYSPNGTQIATGSNDKTVRLWDAQSGAPGHILKGHTDCVKSVVFSPNGAQIASGSWDNTVRLWDTRSGAPGHTLHGHMDSVYGVAYSPSNLQIASCSRDKTVRLWDTRSGAPGHTLHGHMDSVFGVAYSPSDLQIASCSRDKTVRLWDVQSGVPGFTFEGHTDNVNSVVYSLSGTQIASGSDDNTVRLWDVASGRCQAVIEGFGGSIMSLAWKSTLDSTYLVTGSIDKLVCQWQVIEEGGEIQARLSWISPHGELSVRDSSLEGVRGLCRMSAALVKQRGAVGEPIPPLSFHGASKRLGVVAAAAAKFKQVSKTRGVGNPA